MVSAPYRTCAGRPFYDAFHKEMRGPTGGVCFSTRTRPDRACTFDRLGRSELTPVLAHDAILSHQSPTWFVPPEGHPGVCPGPGCMLL